MKAESTPSGDILTLKSEHQATIEVPAGVLGATWDNRTSQLYTACMDGQVLSVDLDSKETRSIGNHESYASGIVMGPEEETVISSGYDGLIIWHDIKSRRPIHVVEAHKFWSWRLSISPNGKHLASSTGQYRSGGYKYEPAAETEPSLRVFDARNGTLSHSFSHIPPVTSIAFSPNSQFLAAGNLMGEIKVFDLSTDQLIAEWESKDFTSWGIIKSHHYIGGIFDLSFTPDGEELIACGMGPMRDPMAGNGKQTWQRFAWKEREHPLTAEIASNEAGKGLMESLAVDSDRHRFAMAGRLAQGQWNTAIFDLNSGSLLHSIDTKMRTTKALFSAQGSDLFLCGAGSQKPPKEGQWPDFGRVHHYTLSAES